MRLTTIDHAVDHLQARLLRLLDLGGCASEEVKSQGDDEHNSHYVANDFRHGCVLLQGKREIGLVFSCRRTHVPRACGWRPSSTRSYEVFWRLWLRESDSMRHFHHTCESLTNISTTVRVSLANQLCSIRATRQEQPTKTILRIGSLTVAVKHKAIE